MKPDLQILGWDVGGTKSAAVVGTAGGKILARQEYPSQVATGPQAMIRQFLDLAGDLRRRFTELAAVGVSIGGPLDTRTGLVRSPPHLPGWDGIDLAVILRKELALPVVVEHDAAACLLAEWYWGAAAGTSHCVYLTCGTGLGAGVMIDGRILRGPLGQSPEFGHVRLAPDGPSCFGKPGCVESFGSGEGISKLAGFMFPGQFPPVIEPARIVEQARGSGPSADAARAVLAESARRTGQACAILADLLIPQVIVLGALARRLGAAWLDGVRAEFAREALAINSAGLRIVPAALDNLQDLSPVAACVYRLSESEDR